MKKRFFVNLLLIALFISCGALSASAPGDILLQLRFYEGIRGPKPAAMRVVTAYTLRPLFVGNFISEKGLQQEEEELKRVFNLKDLAVLVQTQWNWERDQSEKRFQIVVLNGHQFLLQVLKLTTVDAFQVQVIDQAAKAKPALLDSEIVLPAGKVSVFGFEDSLSQPYFLALQRLPDTQVIKEGDLQLIAKSGRTPVPKLLKKVDPVYPEKMLQSGTTASIILQVEADEKGQVRNVQAFCDENEFVKAAVVAVRQWFIEPLVVAGKAQPQTFICTVNFLPSGVALDFSGKSPMTLKQEIMYLKVRSLCEPRLGQKYQAEKITLSFQGAPMSNVVLFLSKTCGILIQVDPAIMTNVNIDLRSLPWDQALARLLDMHGLDIAAHGDQLRIFHPFQAIWPTAGYIGSHSGKKSDGATAALLRSTGKMYYLTSVFGKRLNPLTHEEDFHPGIDIATQKGAPVHSAAAGTVTASGFNEKEGHFIAIDHGNGYSSAYHHLDGRTVKKGDTVSQGQLIGTVGSSGVSTGPHLHFEIRVNGEPRNPFEFIGPAPNK